MKNLRAKLDSAALFIKAAERVARDWHEQEGVSKDALDELGEAWHVWMTTDPEVSDAIQPEVAPSEPSMEAAWEALDEAKKEEIDAARETLRGRVTILVGGERLVSHRPGVCAGRACCVHNPSAHHMREWRQHWRGDRELMERICEHGIGHPDPDHMAYLKTEVSEEDFSEEDFSAEAVHGCDGCCTPPEGR